MTDLVISRESWHYKLYSYLKYSFWSSSGYDPKTLCGYFWSWLWYAAWGLLMHVALIGLVSFFVLAIPLLFWSWLHNGSVQAAGALIMIFGIAATTVAGILIFKGYAIARDKALDKIAEVESGKNLSFFGVILHMIISTKRKVCPFIKYE